MILGQHSDKYDDLLLFEKTASCHIKSVTLKSQAVFSFSLLNVFCIPWILIGPFYPEHLCALTLLWKIAVDCEVGCGSQCCHITNWQKLLLLIIHVFNQHELMAEPRLAVSHLSSSSSLVDSFI